MTSWRKSLSLSLAAVAASLAFASKSLAETAAAPAVAAAPTHPQGWSDQSYYLPMRDGVRLAVSLWFPGGKPPTTKAPVVLIQTRYGRNGIYGHNEDGRYEDFRKAGYVVAVVDTRGSTASFGERRVEMGPDEVRDMDELIHHFQTRSWSNGQVIAMGLSYMADTADLATGSPSRLTGSVVREADFDIYRDLITPGGVANDFMLDLWGDETLRRDTGKSIDPNSPLDCAARAQDCPALWPRLQPVDEDSDYALVRQAFTGRHRWTPADYNDAAFRDDVGHNGFRLYDSSPAAHLAGIRREKVPVQYWGSWMDAGTADSAIARFRSTPGIPDQVIITANNHGGEVSTDPFFSGQNPAMPAFDDQIKAMMDFAAEVRAGQPIGRSIHYYVLGAKTFRDTSVWPPEGVEMHSYALGDGHALVAGASGGSGADRYEVDFSASTGQATRWSTQIGEPAAYPDRRAADAKLLVYDSAAFAKDTEIVGQPDVDLFMTSETKDPAVFVYLEDVAPDGRVTYIDEGQLRAIDRKPADPKTLPYPLDPPQHSFDRADSLPVTPGQPFEIKIALFPVAALIKQGHSVRIAIAGADADTFRRYSEGKPDVFTVFHSAAKPSIVHLPLKPWTTQ